MKPADDGRLTYWASGGDILCANGPLPAVRAAELLAFHAHLAADRRAAGDDAGAYYCERRARELGCALAGADDWRRAAELGRRSPAWA